MTLTLENFEEYYNDFMKFYTETQQDFETTGQANNTRYLDCIAQTGEMFQFLEKFNHFQVARFSNIIKTVYFIRAELLLRTVGIDTGKSGLNVQEKNIYTNIILLLRKVLAIEPFNESAMEMFKIVFIILTIYNSDIDENIIYLKQVLPIHPTDYQLQFNLGFMYQRKNDLDNSLVHLKTAIGIINLHLKSETQDHVLSILKQFKVKCLNSIGSIYYSIQDRESCKYYFNKALETLPTDPDIHNQLGVIYTELRITDMAIKHYSLGIEYAKNSHISNDQDMLMASLYMNMGLAKCYECDFLGGIESYNKALHYKPRLSLAYQNKLLDLNYISYMIEDPMYIAKLHKNINKIYPKVVTNYKESLPDYKVKGPGELIHIGFVSGDFICHPVSYFISSILKNIDYTKFQITCYTCKIVQLHEQYPNCKWKVIKGTNNQELFNIISGDKVDILFDLSAHTGDNRLDTFVLKPAPIQISFCGYPGSSGIKSMDYHITDKIADSKKSEKYYTEKLLYMPHSFLNYTPTLGLEKLPALPSEQPCKKNGYITFGCFNRYNKVNQIVVKTWEKILESIPTARFIIKTKEFSTERIKQKFIDSFENKAILERINILHYSDTYFEHLNDYNLIDIALDTFPYSGTTTSCEALAMGVPVLTIKDTVKHFHSQNVTSSLMHNSNLKEYIVYSNTEYVNKAVEFSKNTETLETLKVNVRDKFFNGHVCNYTEYISDFQELLLDTYSKHAF